LLAAWLQKNAIFFELCTPKSKQALKSKFLMRIIGNIEHPILKITVFKMENRISVKFESGLYEQTYKFRDGEGVETLEDVEKVVDVLFLAQVLQHLNQMHEIRNQTLSRNIFVEENDEFDRII